MGRRIYIIGFMATGKSAAGRNAARQAGCQWFDLDQLIEMRTGMPIPEYMKLHGEAAFREQETAALKSFIRDTDSTGTDSIISCGGGVILREENRALLKDSGLVIRLDAAAETILQRVKDHPDTRPLLKTEADQTLLECINSLQEAREDLYAQTADVTIRTDGLSPDETALLIRGAAGL